MDSYNTKIAEAEYHFRQMCECIEGPRDVYLYKLRAFISSSRSVLQYGIRDSKKAGKNSEYIALLNQFPVVKFFRDIRDLDVHERPIEAQTNESTLVFELVQATSNVEPLDDNDSRWMDPEFEPEQPEVVFISTLETTHTEYRFHDWKGAENATALCDIYLSRIKQIIHTAKSSGFIDISS